MGRRAGTSELGHGCLARLSSLPLLRRRTLRVMLGRMGMCHSRALERRSSSVRVGPTPLLRRHPIHHWTLSPHHGKLHLLARLLLLLLLLLLRARNAIRLLR